MKKFTFNKEELQLIQLLKNSIVNEVYWDFVYIIFVYENYYIKLECKIQSFESKLSNKEIIIASIEKHDGDYTSGKQSILICKNEKISDVFIVRGFIYFRNCREFTRIKRKLKEAGKKIKYKLSLKIKKIFTGKENSYIRLLSNKNSECEEVVCHPRSSRAGQNNSSNAVLMDIGLLLALSNKYIKAYLPNNSFGFPNCFHKQLYDADEIKKDGLLYEFIKMETTNAGN